MFNWLRKKPQEKLPDVITMGRDDAVTMAEELQSAMEIVQKDFSNMRLVISELEISRSQLANCLLELTQSSQEYLTNGNPAVERLVKAIASSKVLLTEVVNVRPKNN